MAQIVEQLIELNEKDWVDIIGILIPIMLTILIIVQNIVYHRQNSRLQREIYNREQYRQ